jgi:BASS family bile acid:Na+ symporter
MGTELLHPVQLLLSGSLIIFMAGNLFETGLMLDLRETVRVLANVRFAAASLFWSFAVGPVFALALTWLLPLAEPFRIALIFLGLAPCAPFLPAMARRAGCRMSDAAAFLLIASLGTIVFMPVLAPILVKGIETSAWAIARPLVLYIALPALAGIAVRTIVGQRADMLQVPVRLATLAATLLMLVLLVVLYGKDFLSMPGTWSIGALVLFCGLLPALAYALEYGLDHSQRSVLALGLSTRNIGAAIAPLFAAPGTDPRAIVMCAMAVPVTLICSATAARIFARLGKIG